MFDTTGIEPDVTENNHKFFNTKLKQTKALSKGNPICPLTDEQVTRLGKSGDKSCSLRYKWVCPKSIQSDSLVILFSSCNSH